MVPRTCSVVLHTLRLKGCALALDGPVAGRKHPARQTSGMEGPRPTRAYVGLATKEARVSNFDSDHGSLCIYPSIHVATFPRSKSDRSTQLKKTPISEGCLADSRVFRSSDRGGARTLDQRINVPHRLSPTTGARVMTRSLATNLRSRVESLDYPFAIAGVPRLVSGAGAGCYTGPLPADYPIRPLFKPSRLPLPATLWCRRLSGRSSILRHPLIAVPRLPARGSVLSFEVRCSTD